MINKIKKGYRKEKIAFDELANYPYRWKTMRNKWCNLDLFREFDVMVANDKELRFIQVKSNGCGNDVRERIKAIKLPKCCKKELWIWKDNKGWSKEIIK
jgi:hypothetical protein